MFLAPAVGSLPEITTLQNHLPRTLAKLNTPACHWAPARPVLLLQKLDRIGTAPAGIARAHLSTASDGPHSLQRSKAAQLSTWHSDHVAGPQQPPACPQHGCCSSLPTSTEGGSKDRKTSKELKGLSLFSLSKVYIKYLQKFDKHFFQFSKR